MTDSTLKGLGIGKQTDDRLKKGIKNIDKLLNVGLLQVDVLLCDYIHNYLVII